MALASYRNGDMGFNECCRHYNIPKPTLKRHLAGKNVVANESVKATGRTTTLPPEVEQQLVDHILRLEHLLFGVTITDVRKLAFQIAERNEIPHNFNRLTAMAGKKWFYAFKARHKDIALRTPESTSMARAKGFNKKNVLEFFDILESVIDEHKLDATRVFNVDETGFSTVQKRCQKVLAMKGKRQVGAIASGERGVNTTIVCCTSASGMYVPPMIIFKRMRMANELQVGAPPGGIVDISETGYINSDLFVKWLRHFIAVIKPNTGNKVLLILDGHSTHSKNVEALDLAHANGILMLQLPAHTTHRLQPLDRSFFKPLETYYTQAVEKWLRTNPGLCVTQYQVTQLVAEAYARAATIQNAMNGFRACGIWPVDRNVFNDSDFSPAANLEEHECHSNENEKDSPSGKPTESISDQTGNEIGLIRPNDTQQEMLSTLNVPIDAISPIPTCSKHLSKPARRGAQRAVVLTSSPYKRDLIAAKDRRRKTTSPKSTKGKGRSGCTNKRLRTTPADNAPTTSHTSDVTIEVGQDDWFCSVCEESVIENMVQCLQCRTWVHETCAGVKSGLKRFLCVECK